MAVKRFDLLGPISVKTGARHDSQTGYLHAPVRATRTGVLIYRKADGSISRELRHPDDVFAADSLETLKRVVVVEGHPRNDNGEAIDVNTSNVERLQVGHGGDTIRRDEHNGYLHPVVDVTITRAPIVKKILDGLSQVSMGYLVDVIDEKGVFNGEPYDRRHTNIRYNHMAAAIPAGRAGTAAFQLDEADAVLELDDNNDKRQQQRRSDSMHTLTIDGVTIKFDDAGAMGIVKGWVEKRDAQIDAAKAEAKKKADELEATQAKLDQAEKEAKAAGEKKGDAADVGKAVGDVLEVLTHAQQVIDVDDDFRQQLLELKPDDGADLPAAIRKAVVLKACEDEADAIKAKSPAYFEARFDALVSAVKKSDSTKALGKKVVDMAKSKSTDKGKRSDSLTVDEEQAKLDEQLDDVFAVDDPLDAMDNPKDFKRVGDRQRKKSA